MANEAETLIYSPKLEVESAKAKISCNILLDMAFVTLTFSFLLFENSDMMSKNLKNDEVS